jgi:hypothetical protein
MGIAGAGGAGWDEAAAAAAGESESTGGSLLADDPEALENIPTLSAAGASFLLRPCAIATAHLLPSQSPSLTASITAALARVSHAESSSGCCASLALAMSAKTDRTG